MISLQSINPGQPTEILVPSGFSTSQFGRHGPCRSAERTLLIAITVELVEVETVPAHRYRGAVRARTTDDGMERIPRVPRRHTHTEVTPRNTPLLTPPPSQRHYCPFQGTIYTHGTVSLTMDNRGWKYIGPSRQSSMRYNSYRQCRGEPHGCGPRNRPSRSLSRNSAPLSSGMYWYCYWSTAMLRHRRPHTRRKRTPSTTRATSPRCRDRENGWTHGRLRKLTDSIAEYQATEFDN